MIRSLLLCLTALLLGTAFLSAQNLRDGPKLSPFRGMRKAGEGIEVQVLDDTWYGLESVGGVTTKKLCAEAKRLCGGRDWKRITEDMPALFDAMGHPLEMNVDIVVRSLQTGKKQAFDGVRMTRANRRRVKEGQREERGRRKMMAIGDVVDGHLVLPADAAREDLAVLRQLLDTRFAYRDLRGVDLNALVRKARGAISQKGIGQVEFVQTVDHILRTFGDGHSRLRSSSSRNALWTPFLISAVEGGHVAFRSDRSGFVDADHPFVTAIDGVPLAKWLAAAKERVTKGSAVMQASKAERGLRELTLLRRALGLPTRDVVELTLRSSKVGGSVRKLVEKVAVKKPLFGAWPRTETVMLDGNIGYLRVPRMERDAAFLDGLDQAMQDFRLTTGLVIDVRGNGGGTRDALRRLAPYFLPADGTPVVGNVAAFLLEDGKPAPPDALANRYLYRPDWDGWSDRERGVIGKLLRTFKPSWKLPAGKFSPLHFLVLDKKHNPKAYRYEHKVVVLIDRGCFSATDIFAAAMQAIPGVTLVGEATAGGSGRARSYQLPNSGLRLQLSTMASFRPDGTLFEGNGVVPDVAVPTRATDLIGKTDTALSKALELLR